MDFLCSYTWEVEKSKCRTHTQVGPYGSKYCMNSCSPTEYEQTGGGEKNTLIVCDEIVIMIQNCVWAVPWSSEIWMMNSRAGQREQLQRARCVMKRLKIEGVREGNWYFIWEIGWVTTSKKWNNIAWRLQSIWGWICILICLRSSKFYQPCRNFLTSFRTSISSSYISSRDVFAAKWFFGLQIIVEQLLPSVCSSVTPKLSDVAFSYRFSLNDFQLFLPSYSFSCFPLIT